jgi:hypothetical protein
MPRGPDGRTALTDPEALNSCNDPLAGRSGIYPPFIPDTNAIEALNRQLRKAQDQGQLPQRGRRPEADLPRDPKRGAAADPRSPHMLDACDRLGILVYNEFSDMWDIAKTADDDSNYFVDWWQRDLTSMVLRDPNHPNVIICSLGNEISADPNNYGPQLMALVRSLDTTRPITAGGTKAPYADVIDTHGKPSAVIHTAGPDKAVIRSENVALELYHDWQFAQNNAWFVGSSVWSGWDYIGEAGIGAPAAAATEAQAQAVGFAEETGQVPYPWFVGFSGDIDLIGQASRRTTGGRWSTGSAPLRCSSSAHPTRHTAVRRGLRLLRRAAQLDMGRSQRAADDRAGLHVGRQRHGAPQRQARSHAGPHRCGPAGRDRHRPLRPRGTDGDREPGRPPDRPHDARHHGPARRVTPDLRRQVVARLLHASDAQPFPPGSTTLSPWNASTRATPLASNCCLVIGQRNAHRRQRHR